VTRAPTDRSTPARAAAPTASLLVTEATRTKAAQDRFAAIPPRVDARLTSRLQLRPNRPRSLAGPSTASRCHPGAAFSTTHRADDRPLALLSRLALRPANRTLRAAPRTASTVLPSRRAAFPAPERLPSTSAPLSRFRGPVWCGSPPPTRGFAADEPASDADSLPSLARDEARPDDDSTGSSPVAAKGRAPLADFCNRDDPRARPRDRPDLAHHARGLPRAQLLFASGGGSSVAGPLARTSFEGLVPTEMSRARGRRGFHLIMHGASRRDRSRWELHPNPIGSDTSCRRARDDACRNSLRRRDPRRGPLLRACQ
jgi:hypothetical protein